jgi:D-apionolactonase
MVNGKGKPTREESIILRAGPISMLFEPGSAFLRYIRLGNQEILRGIYVAVRDDVWGTIAPEISNLNLKAEQDHFKLTFEVSCRRNEIDFSWQGAIIGNSNGKVVYSMDGIARSRFKSNRIGFCVLHPIQTCAGKQCVVEKVDGSKERGFFPKTISPYQPFQNMRGISYGVTPASTVEICLEGDIFEMEDQRNWCDASFKTYCRPLSLPFPFEVIPGQNISQTITFVLKGTKADIPVQTTFDSEISFRVDPSVRFRMPYIGLQMASHGIPLTEFELQCLKKLNIHHLRVDLDLENSEYPVALSRAHSEAEALGILLEIALFLGRSPEDELCMLLNELQVIKPKVSSWLLFHLGEHSLHKTWISLARKYLSQYDSRAKIGMGSNHYFADLNRSSLPVDLLDFACYPVNPQVHASDNASIVETFPILAEMVENARLFTSGISIAVTPVTLKSQPAPLHYGGNVFDQSDEDFPYWADVRQTSLFGAGWTLGTLKYLAQGGVDSVTYFETTGPLGVMESTKSSRFTKQSERFSNKVFPIFRILADVGEYVGGMVLKTVSSDPLTVEGLALINKNRLMIILANLTSKETQVSLASLESQMSICYLSRENAANACDVMENYRAQTGEIREPANGLVHLELGPYSLARIKTIPFPSKSDRIP